MLNWRRIRMETGRPVRDWLVFYCCTENYHRISTLKQHKFTISQFPWVWSQRWHVWALCSGSHGLKSRHKASFLKEGSGKDPLLSSFNVVGRIHFPVLVGLIPQFPRSLSARHLLSPSRAYPHFGHVAFCIFSPATALWILSL